MRVHDNNNLNIENGPLEVCGKKPLTGFYRDGFCRTGNMDLGTHTVCAKTDSKFLEFTKSRGNDLSGSVKKGENWCLCQNRWLEAYRHGVAPLVLIKSTNKNTRGEVLKAIKNTIRKGRKRKSSRVSEQYFFYDPKKPNNGYDVYVDKNPMDTIPIKYTTMDDIKHTIQKLESLYKSNKYPHKRIWQVAMIMKVRLGVIKKYAKERYPRAKNVTRRYNLAEKYYNFLKQRTTIKGEKNRKKLVFNL